MQFVRIGGVIRPGRKRKKCHLLQQKITLTTKRTEDDRDARARWTCLTETQIVALIVSLYQQSC